MSIDPALLEERDFLLGSLDDLEAEYAAGDLDDADYESLKADYTTRAARVLRAIEAGSSPHRSRHRRRSEPAGCGWPASPSLPPSPGFSSPSSPAVGHSTTRSPAISGSPPESSCSKRSNCSGKVISTLQSTCTTTSSSCRPPTRRPCVQGVVPASPRQRRRRPAPRRGRRRDRPRVRRRSSVRHGHRPRRR